MRGFGSRRLADREIELVLGWMGVTVLGCVSVIKGRFGEIDALVSSKILSLCKYIKYLERFSVKVLVISCEKCNIQNISIFSVDN